MGFITTPSRSWGWEWGGFWVELGWHCWGGWVSEQIGIIYRYCHPSRRDCASQCRLHGVHKYMSRSIGRLFWSVFFSCPEYFRGREERSCFIRRMRLNWRASHGQLEESFAHDEYPMQLLIWDGINCICDKNRWEKMWRDDTVQSNAVWCCLLDYWQEEETHLLA